MGFRGFVFKVVGLTLGSRSAVVLGKDGMWVGDGWWFSSGCQRTVAGSVPNNSAALRAKRARP